MAYIEEKRGKDLIEGRAVTIASGSLALPRTTGRDIPGGTPDVLADLARVVTLRGNGNSYDAPYILTQPTAGVTVEGADATAAEPTFGSVRINGGKITAYAELSREVRKLPLASYDEVVSTEARKALKRKIGADMISKIYGSTAVKKVSIAAIDKDALDAMIWEIQRPEGVEGPGTLVLSLADAKAFAQVKTTGGRRAYEITFDGVKGIINGLPFLVSTHAETGSPVYGYFDAFQIVYFSDAEVRRSDASGFKSGLDAYLADAVVGGDVVVPDAFVVANK